ncbi:abscission/NoCut checkpoint regulator [Trichoplusia ni]|uniref:Abscission/NoCut checkpoint regulator n=1 Tax=Trichoplusia ni TaxID=7111 RepID=A0A7E5WWY3_TRINI|nr:abscission/NoCut checkpoint regulator [Trichoplusia ni]
MSCNSCAKSFSILRKEKGCPGCGYSYCSKCLDHKMFLTKLNAEVKVCAKCKNLTQKPNEPKKVEAPDAYYRRIGAMEVKQVATNTGNLGLVDQEILARLQKLKEGRDPTPTGVTDEEVRNRLQKIKDDMPTSSDAEIQARLAKLKGIPIQISSSKPVLPPPDTRTEQEQANDLLKQYLEQTKIETKYNDEFNEVISDIESRMQKLKGSTGPSAQNSKEDPGQNVESEDEEETVKKIVEKIKAEAVLDPDDISPTTIDELPFCEICNEDAKMRCLGCKYLFCKRCFMEHKDDDDGCNRYEPYHPPKNQNY